MSIKAQTGPGAEQSVPPHNSRAFEIEEADWDFLNSVDRELSRARAKFGDIRNDHEGYAVILEELDEFWEGVRTKGTTPEALRAELVQVAAMACRCAVDVKREGVTR